MTDELDDGSEPYLATRRWPTDTLDPFWTPFERWCIAQATAHADRIATLAPTPHGSLDGRTRPAVRDDTWRQTAARQYTMLSHGIRDAISEPATACFVANSGEIRAWLTRPAPHPYSGNLAEYLDLHHSSPDWAGFTGLAELVEHAQVAGLFGVPQHTISLHNVVDFSTGWAGHLLTIDTPTGASMATGRFNSRLVTGEYTGLDAAVHTLQRCAVQVDNTLAEHARTTAATQARARPFPPLGPDRQATPVNNPAPQPSPAPSRQRHTPR
jgi:hypothetical protein